MLPLARAIAPLTQGCRVTTSMCHCSPHTGLPGIKEGMSTTSSQEKPLSFTAFDRKMAALKKQYNGVRSPTSDQDTSN